jgi:hypothetical protein
MTSHKQACMENQSILIGFYFFFVVGFLGDSTLVSTSSETFSLSLNVFTNVSANALNKGNLAYSGAGYRVDKKRLSCSL